MEINQKTRILKVKSTDLFNYANNVNPLINRADKSETLIISDRSHFFYTGDEIKNFKNIIDVRKLNYVFDLNDFVRSLNKMTNREIVYYGRFINNRVPLQFSKTGAFKRLKMTIKFINQPKNKFLSDKDITILFRSHGFIIMDMKVTRGITQFCAKKL